MYILLDKEYEVKCTLGTIREIEKRFGKGFYEVMKGIDKMSISDQLKMLYIGISKANNDIGEEKFYVLADEYFGAGDLADVLEKFIYQLQYPGLTSDEIQEKIQKKLMTVKARQEIISNGIN